MVNPHPKISIVVPCRNELNYIKVCIDSILNQDYENLELLVCDGMSDDGTRDILASYLGNDKIKVLDNVAQITPIALNLGIQNATGEIIIIFGAHAIMNSDYVSKCIETFAIDHSIGCAGGVLNQVNENDAAATISLAMSSIFGVGNAYFRTGTKSGYVDTVAFGAYKKEVFEKIGFFDDELVRNQDDEFNFRVLQAGYKIYLNKEIQADYFVRGSFDKLWRQYYQYGYWKVYVNRKHKTVTTVRQLIPVIMVSAFGITILLAMLIPIFWNWFFLGTFLYMFSAFYYGYQKTQFDYRIRGVLKSFAILHFSYGFGYLKGIWDFLIVGKKMASLKDQKMSR